MKKIVSTPDTVGGSPRIDGTRLTLQDFRSIVDEGQACALTPAARERVQAAHEVILEVAAFVEANPDIRELDLNPMLVYPEGAIAVDARIVIADAPGGAV